MDRGCCLFFGGICLRGGGCSGGGDGSDSRVNEEK